MWQLAGLHANRQVAGSLGARIAYNRVFIQMAFIFRCFGVSNVYNSDEEKATERLASSSESPSPSPLDGEDAVSENVGGCCEL